MPSDCGKAEDLLPLAYGKLNEQPEAVDALRDNGWCDLRWKHNLAYDPASSIARSPQAFNADIGRYQRRRIDQFVLMSHDAAKFEAANPLEVGPHRYHYRNTCNSLNEDVASAFIRLALGEFCDLSYLFPLAAVGQVARDHPLVPLIQRSWKFVDRPQAFVKTSKMRILQIDGEPGSAFAQLGPPAEDQITAPCIVCEPPSLQQLRVEPRNALLYWYYRTHVGHELGHYIIEQSNKLRHLHDRFSDDTQQQQAASLLSVFLVMYRRHMDRRPLADDCLAETFSGLRFESQWAQTSKAVLIARIKSLLVQDSPRHEWLPRFLTRQRPALPPEEPCREDTPRCTLDHDQIRTVRLAASQLAESARPFALAPMACVVQLRKVDNYLALNRVPRSKGGNVSWTACDVQAQNVKFPDVHYTWRQYNIDVPGEEGEPIWDCHFRKLIYEIANIRLFGGGYGDKTAPMTSDEVLTKCTSTERDLARIVALTVCAFRGERIRKRYTIDHARFLLNQDSEGLREIAPFSEKYFYWSTEDAHYPDAEDKFLGQVDSISRTLRRVYFSLWGEDEARMSASLALAAFEQSGFDELEEGECFKVLGIQQDGRQVLKPLPLRS